MLLTVNEQWLHVYKEWCVYTVDHLIACLVKTYFLKDEGAIEIKILAVDNFLFT